MPDSPRKIRSISDFHKLRGLPGPKHPLISLVDYSKTVVYPENLGEFWTMSHYSIAVKGNVGTLRYGQQEYDFDEGVMSFMAPGQVMQIDPNTREGVKPWGWILLIHPEFLYQSPLASKIRRHELFGYAVNEALFLSESEKGKILGIFAQIREEYESGIDSFSQDIMIAQIDLLLTYADRFYKRQFITRQVSSHDILDKLENLLVNWFEGDNLLNQGLPSVQYLAGELNLSPNYLSNMLKELTGQTTQQHIHDMLISKAKEKLSVSTLTVSQVAYELGFEHPQSFSKFFKAKTEQTPGEFRKSFTG